jgi:nucleotide-binding universal stress UspA family protein
MSFETASAETMTGGRSRSTGRIVVGVDGSQGSRAALEWSIREARVRSCRMHILVVWQYPHATSASAWGLGMDPSPDIREAVSTATAEAANRLGLTASSQSGVATTWEAIEGFPARVLITASEDAELLVVGSRGHGAFVGALLGSVSHQVVAHARCPVVVVPTPRAEEDRIHAEPEIRSAGWSPTRAAGGGPWLDQFSPVTTSPPSTAGWRGIGAH